MCKNTQCCDYDTGLKNSMGEAKISTGTIRADLIDNRNHGYGIPKLEGVLRPGKDQTYIELFQCLSHPIDVATSYQRVMREGIVTPMALTICLKCDTQMILIKRQILDLPYTDYVGAMH